MSNFKLEQMDMGASDIDSFLGNPAAAEGGAYTGRGLLAKLDVPSFTDYDLQSIQMGGAMLEPAFDRAQQSVTATRKTRVRVASVKQLSPFMRISADTLVHRSNRDLWALRKEGDGDFYIERLFDDNGSPVKG